MVGLMENTITLQKPRKETVKTSHAYCTLICEGGR